MLWPLVPGVAFLVSLLALPLVRSWALRGDVVDIPNERSSHTVPKPRIGGVAILLGFVSGIGTLFLISPSRPESPLITLFVTLIALGAVGFIDDLKPLPIRLRMPLYLTGALTIACASASIDRFSLPLLIDWHLAPVLAIGFTTLLIAWYTNLFNFMDGIDGIAGSSASVTMLSLALVFGTQGQLIPCGLTLSIAGATAGFLPYNIAPSSVFMGDGGSVFLGSACGSLTALAIQESYISLIAGLLIMFPFVFDATFTLARRAIQREKIWKAHRSHIYQQLGDLGYSHRDVATTYLGAAVFTASLGLIYDHTSQATQFLLISLLVVSATTAACLVLRKNEKMNS